jgi:hypothetical protein
MNQPINPKTTTLTARNSISPATAGRRFLFLALALTCFTLCPTPIAFGVSPAPDGGYANDNTAEGTSALFSNTTGFGNTAIGFQALTNNTTGDFNTATGSFALVDNETGHDNTATGPGALGTNITGSNNTATGSGALCGCVYEDLDTGNNNTATGFQALYGNVTGNNNTATGVSALENNGYGGNDNTATGVNALEYNYAGSNNTAEGAQALENSTGSNNIAVGSNAGINLTEGSNNIYIGVPGVAVESNTIRIGTVGVHKTAFMRGISGATVPSGVPVIVNTNGKLGTIQSSARFKDEIKPMDKASEAILALKPVTFRYKHQLDPDGIPQFGLVAEQVEKVNPDLVARDEQGKVYSVRYEAVNAMLLNEFLKEHRKVQQLEAAAAEQQKEMKALTASIKEQAAQIQKVSAQLELDKPAPQMIANNQ